MGNPSLTTVLRKGYRELGQQESGKKVKKNQVSMPKVRKDQATMYKVRKNQVIKNKVKKESSHQK